MYKVVGFNKEHKWTFGQGADAKSGVNQVFYVVNMDEMINKGCAGYRTDIIKASANFDSSSIAVGKTYDFYFNKFGALQECKEVKSDVK